MGKTREFQTPLLPVLMMCCGSPLVPQLPTPLSHIWPKPDTFPILPPQKAQHKNVTIRHHDHGHGARTAPAHCHPNCASVIALPKCCTLVVASGPWDPTFGLRAPKEI